MSFLGIGLTNPFTSVNHLCWKQRGRNNILSLQPKLEQQTNVSDCFLLFIEYFCYFVCFLNYSNWKHSVLRGLWSINHLLL